MNGIIPRKDVWFLPDQDLNLVIFPTCFAHIHRLSLVTFAKSKKLNWVGPEYRLERGIIEVHTSNIALKLSPGARINDSPKRSVGGLDLENFARTKRPF
jgi:hypothetical protein